MRNKNSFRVFTGAYSVARSAGLLNNSFAKRLFVSSYFLYKRFWEDPFWGLTRRMPDLFQSGDILDIGANVGFTSCLFANALKSGSKVYSFEPDDANFQLLQDVIRRKKLSERIIPIHSAVGNMDGRIELWHNEKHSGDHRVATPHFKRTLSDSTEIFSADVVSVDSFVESRSLTELSFIKIDVQGYELAVCEGMKETLEKWPGICVCCEYAPEGLLELGFDPVQLLDFFRTNGFHVHILTRSSIESGSNNYAIHQIAGKAGYVDLLCSRRDLS
jgi:FkbM family methyltransferase